MPVTVVSLGGLKLVGLKVVGRRSELSHRVPLAWTELLARLGDIPHRVAPDVFYGVSPESDYLGDSADAVYTYWVCTEVSGCDTVAPGLATLHLAPATYAMARVVGTAEAIESTYLGLADWLAGHGRLTDGAAHSLERYDVRNQPVTPPYTTFDYEILKPLRP
ncbi:GyrI-like domain-containing protein [Myxococcus stipitatus]|uniref:GyrI-like domain-containing protein n=1 Tax=Myxococcus stipitatus TaxID=83455 RepID=UPI001F3FDE8E|nr:GyrI-like domain-containing protein [Myxococcus stipitatus]MCE9672438.1 GyrI-like domain-containing protein [Myxococcus stipitatus]